MPRSCRLPPRYRKPAAVFGCLGRPLGQRPQAHPDRRERAARWQRQCHLRLGRQPGACITRGYSRLGASVSGDTLSVESSPTATTYKLTSATSATASRRRGERRAQADMVKVDLAALIASGEKFAVSMMISHEAAGKRRARPARIGHRQAAGELCRIPGGGWQGGLFADGGPAHLSDTQG